jgi:hypothetical protein
VVDVTEEGAEAAAVITMIAYLGEARPRERRVYFEQAIALKTPDGPF